MTMMMATMTMPNDAERQPFDALRLLMAGGVTQRRKDAEDDNDTGDNGGQARGAPLSLSVLERVFTERHARPFFSDFAHQRTQLWLSVSR